MLRKKKEEKKHSKAKTILKQRVHFFEREKNSSCKNKDFNLTGKCPNFWAGCQNLGHARIFSSMLVFSVNFVFIDKANKALIIQLCTRTVCF